MRQYLVDDGLVFDGPVRRFGSYPSLAAADPTSVYIDVWAARLIPA